MVAVLAILPHLVPRRSGLLPIALTLLGSCALVLLLAPLAGAAGGTAAALAPPLSTITWRPESDFSEPYFDDISPAVHPSDPLRALVGGPTPIRYTTDGGVSWQSGAGLDGLNPGVPAWVPGGDGQSALQVSLAQATRQPQASLTPGPTGNALNVARSTDSGLHWSAPITLTIPGVAENLPYLWADSNPSSPYYGRMYLTLTMLDAARTGSFDTVGMLFSTDQGATWSPPVGLVNPAEYAQGTNYNAFASAAIQPGGGVVVAWHRGTCCQTISNVPNKIMWSRSTDGGVTFPVSGTIATVPISQSLEYNTMAPGTFRWTPAPNIAADPVDGTLYAVWVAYRQPDTPMSAAIYLSSSTDNGASWSSPAVVGNDGSSVYQYMPWVQVSPDHVVHLTFQGAILRDLISHFYVQSTDRGATWSTPFKLTGNGYSYFGQGDIQATSLGGYNGSQGTILTSWQIMIGSGVRLGTFPLGGGGTPTATATATCIAAGTPGPWAVRANYPLMLTDVAVASDGTTVYAFGGRNGSGRHSQAYKYDYASDSWSAIASFPYDAIAEAEAEYGQNGKIYVIWGNGTYIYDIATNSWSLGAPTPQSEISFGHAYWNGKIYVIGSYVNIATNAAYAYDIATDSWSTLAPIPQAEGLVAAAAIDGKIYVANGQTTGGVTNNLYIYDIATDTWTQGPSSPLASSGPGSTAVGGKLYMIGGRPQSGSSTANTYLYDPATYSWSQGPGLNLARNGGNAAIISTPGGQTAMVVGGMSGVVWLNSVEASTAPLVPCATSTSTATRTRTPIATATSVPPTLTSTSVAPSYTPAPSTNTVVPPSNTPPAPSRTPQPPTGTVVSTPTSCTLSFSDVLPGSTFYPYIRCLACRGIATGYSDGTFRPNNNITRGQISKIVCGASTTCSRLPAPAGQSYQDVVPGSTFYVWIEKLTSMSVMAGYPCGTNPNEPCVPPLNRPYFRPFSNATRGQLSKIVSNAAHFQEPPEGQTFEDVPPDNPFYAWIQRLAARGIMAGYACGSNPNEPCVPPLNRPYFRWGANVTRGQASKIVANAFFPDCQTPGSR